MLFVDADEVLDDVPWGGVLVCKLRTTNAIVATTRTMMTATTAIVVPIPRRGGVIPIRRLQL